MSSIDKIYFYNRYKQSFPDSDWVIIGVSIHHHSTTSKSIRICFFGFELRILIKK